MVLFASLAFSHNLEQVGVEITANGLSEWQKLESGKPIQLGLGLFPGPLSGEEVEIYLYDEYPDGNTYYVDSSLKGVVKEAVPMYRGPFPEYSNPGFMNISTDELPLGEYVYHLAVEHTADKVIICLSTVGSPTCP
jgi:hypothetical protein